MGTKTLEKHQLAFISYHDFGSEVFLCDVTQPKSVIGALYMMATNNQ